MRRSLFLAGMLAVIAPLAFAQQTKTSLNDLPVPSTGSTFMSNGDHVVANRNGVTYQLIDNIGGTCGSGLFVSSISGQGVPSCTSPGAVTAITIGTSVTNANPFVNGHLNYGMYTDGSSLVGITINGTSIERWTSSGATTVGTQVATTFSGSGASLTSIGTSNMTAVTGTPSSSTFLRGDNSWAAPGGSGTVTTTGSPASGNLSKFSGSTSITNGDLTGDITTSGTLGTVLATVNSNTGSFGSSTAIPQFTVNGKGLITAAQTNAVIAPAGTLTGATLASGVTASSLTSVGSLTSLTMGGNLTLSTHNLITDTSTGSDIGTSSTQKLGFFGATPIVQTTGNICTAMTALGLITSCTESGGGGSVTGTGVNNYMTNWTGTTSIGTSNITTNASSFIGIGTSSPLVSVDDSTNTDAVAIPVGTNGTRPSHTINGEVRYNSTTNTKGWIESFNNFGTSVWVILQTLVGSGLDPAASASANSTALQGQENALITLGTSSLATDWGIPGIQIPRGTYALGAGINMAPWIKLQTSGTVQFDASSNSATTVTTNATTLSSSAVLHFASGGTACKPGEYLIDTTTPAHITTGTQVAFSTVPTATTITMTQNAASTVGNGDIISCSYVAFDLTNDQVPSGSFTNFGNFANASPVFNSNDGSIALVGPGSAVNSIGLKLGSELATPGTDNNVRDVHLGPVFITSFATDILFVANSNYINHFDQGGHLSGSGNKGFATSQGASNNNAGENIHFSGGWTFDGLSDGMYFDTPNIDTVSDGNSFDFLTHASTSTANDGFSRHAFLNGHFEALTDMMNCASSNQGFNKYVFHNDKYVENEGVGPRHLFVGACNLDVDELYVGGYDIPSNDPAKLFMADSNVIPERMRHITFTGNAQLTAFKLLSNDDPCMGQGVVNNDLTSAPPSTYTSIVTNTGASANTGITGIISNTVVWTTGDCSTSKSMKFTETNTTNSYTEVGDRFPVSQGDVLAMDVIFQTNKPTSTASLQTEYLYSYCNGSITPTAQGFFGDTIGSDVGANTWAKMSYVDINHVPAGVCFAQPVINLSALAAGEVIYVGFIGVNAE